MFSQIKSNFGRLAICGLLLFGMASVAAFNAQSAPTALVVEIKHVTAKDFKQEVEDSKVPVIVDFYATWCGPCKMLAPHLQALAAEYGGKVKIVKVDGDVSADLRARFGIDSYPTLLTFKNGKQVEKLPGYRGLDALRKIADSLLK